MTEQQNIYSKPELLRYWVWLSLVFSAGSSGLNRYIADFQSPDALYEALQAGTVNKMTAKLKESVAKHTLGEADSIVYYCKMHDIMLIPIKSDYYPEELRSISAPPILLTAVGNPEILRYRTKIAIVGTRRPSQYSQEVTAAMVEGLRGHNIVITSGFAKGVDAIAHTAALAADLPTIAVMGCGINVNYPKDNQRLREQILSSNNGLFLSEYMPGVQPYPGNFPKRNRILSGLCCATAVIEAAQRSGSLVTARLAIDQGRSLLCVPPADLFDGRYAGVIPLLRDGAVPLMSPEDLFAQTEFFFPPEPRTSTLIAPDEVLKDDEETQKAAEKNAAAEHTLQKEAQTAAALHDTAKPAQKPKQKNAEKQKAAKKETEAFAMPLPEEPEQRAIVQYLREHGQAYAEDLAEALDIALSDILSLMLELELSGYVDTLFGRQYRAI